jgi:hypothetical protein
MRRFLIVGCGGSGGATLAFMMDQLSSELAESGVTRIPLGWQFVHVDVPTGEEPAADGLGTVSQQGGAYFGIGPQGGSYPILDASVSQTFSAAGNLGAIATWAPREPLSVTVPIDSGAGQYRSIGRMITLSRAGDLRAKLAQSWERLFSVEATSEMSRLGAAVPGLGDFTENDEPLVLVVSSMAGGSGASMALDVCRLLATLPDANPARAGVFMVSAEVFDALPADARSGVRANALAMLGEIVASQSGAAAAHDASVLAAVGENGGAGSPIPFGRVFPVGRYLGTRRTKFGSGTPAEVYRGLGRGLAGLVMSGTATRDFIAYDLTNTHSSDGDRDVLGWGSAWDPLPWGSFGFATLSMGRDRYAEYAAQRLARASVDRLVRGHLQVNSTASPKEQLRALVESQWLGALSALQIPANQAANDEPMHVAVRWLKEQAVPGEEVRQSIRNAMDSRLRPDLPTADGMQARQWLSAVRSAANRRRSMLVEVAETTAYDRVYRWQEGFGTRLVDLVQSEVARLGLTYADGILERLTAHLNSLLPGIQALVDRPLTEVASVPERVDSEVGTLKDKAITQGQGLLDRLVEGYSAQVRELTYARIAGLMVGVLGGVVAELIPALRTAVKQALRLLEQAEATAVRDLGLARVSTDQVPAWPGERDVRVDKRFEQAVNEVLLTSVADYQAQYESDVRRAVFGDSADQAFAAAGQEAVTQVIAGRWATTGGQDAPGGLVTETVVWRCRIFPTEPGTGRPITPILPTFDVHVRPPELLGRARQFVARPHESFDQFVSLSLRDFVVGSMTAEADLSDRRNEVADKFRSALTLALPLIGVNPVAVHVVHGANVEYRYKFSEIPFEGLPLADDLRTALGASDIDMTSITNYGNSISQSSVITRIKIFGSYQNYSPVVFDAVLGPVADQWGKTPERGQESFWRWRRARPLPAALPMGDAERTAMVSGWFLGQVVGKVAIPAPPYGEPVRIWDSVGQCWVPFPHPLLTPPIRFIQTFDWLPAVLESSLIAIARSHQHPAMSSLRPYQLLRGLWDDHSQEPTGGIHVRSAVGVLLEWLPQGATPADGQSRVPDIDLATTVADRVERASAWLNGIHDLAGRDFMQAGQGRARGGGRFSAVTSRAMASSTPFFRDLAPDVFQATGDLLALLAEVQDAAETIVAGGAVRGEDPWARSLPGGGTF